MSKKLAITIAGAVSLGSYEAGVLWEVLDAIRQNNKDADDEDKIIIDVITGASAGGMTAVILAQKLLYCCDEFKDPYDNPLFNTWVKGIGLEQLQSTQADEDPLHSVFSSDLIAQISRNTVLKRYQTPPKEEAKKHPAVNKNLSVGLALTNMNGLPYSHDVQTGGKFTYIDFSDQMTRNIDADQWDDEQHWEPLRQAAVACGAFPIAFRAQDIERSRTRDAADYGPTLQWAKTDTMTFTYCDGGVLQNQPLGMAKNLVDSIDNHFDQNKRFYLFVSPHAKDPQPVEFCSEQATYFEVIRRLVGVAVGQAGFRDWITAEGVNQSVRLLDTRADQLQEQICKGTIDVQPLQAVASQLLKLFFEDPNRSPQPGAEATESLTHAQNRIARQYSKELSDLQNIPHAPDAFRDAVLAFETAAGLAARDIMRIYAITAKENTLAGAGLQSFLGFFNVKYRLHDYNSGRINARKALTDILSKADQLGIKFKLSGDEPAPMPEFDGPQLHKLSPDDRKLFETGMKKRINAMIKETDHLLGEAWAADRIVDAFINHLTRPIPADVPLGPAS